MRIGSWPGVLGGNAFMSHLRAGMEGCGIEYVPVDAPSKCLSFDGDALLIQFPDQVFWRTPRQQELLKKSELFKRTNHELNSLAHIKARGVKLIWVVHNLVPHDLTLHRKLIWILMSFRLAGMVDGFMSLSPTTYPLIIRRHRRLAGVPYSFFRHPAYEGIVLDRSVAEARRQELGVGAGELLVGALGMVGPYKGTEDLVKAFQLLSGNQYRLIIAGNLRSPKYAKQISRLAQNDPRIICKFERLSDDDFARTTAACDVLAAPYRNYLHSGSLVYAVSAQRLIITPTMPFVTDLAQVVGNEWFLTYEGNLNATVLRCALDTPRPAQPANLTELSSTQAGERIRAFVEYLKSLENSTHRHRVLHSTIAAMTSSER